MRVVCLVLDQLSDEDSSRRRYEVEVAEGATVLSVLGVISEQAPELAFTLHNCKTGICGGCQMIIDGRRRLACRTLVTTTEVRVAPVPGRPPIKDLLVDLL